MKYLITLLLAVFFTYTSIAQNLSEKAFLAVVNEEPSTAPGFLPVTIINANNGVSKEMYLSVNELFNCLETELNESDYKQVKKYLLANSGDRKISLKNRDALKYINFENYNVQTALKREQQLIKIIEDQHIVDSLSKITKAYDESSNLFDDYYNLRHKLSKNIADSLSLLAPLNKKKPLSYGL